MRAFTLMLVPSLLLMWGCQAEDTSHSAPLPDPANLAIEDKEANEGFVPVEGHQSEMVKNSLTGRLRAAHALADEAQSGKQIEAALVELEQLFTLTDAEEGPHILAVRQDLAARIAEFKLKSGELSGAASAAQQGLALTDKPTLLRANLFIVLADIEEAQSNTDAATVALMSALTINQHLFDAELETP